MNIISLIIFNLLCLAPLFLRGEQATKCLPGRLGSEEICYTQLGKAKVFFYMTPEKNQQVHHLVSDINEKVMLSFGIAAAPCPLTEVLFASSSSKNDPIGKEVLENYSAKAKEIIEKKFKINVKALSCYVNVDTGFDAIKIHRDLFTSQYEYLNKHPLPIPRYHLFQDLCLLDWQMAKGTFAATMVQDGEAGDRFLMVFFPGEIVGTVYAEPAPYPGPDINPVYPGPVNFPYHSSVVAIDFHGDKTVGSWKGKRMSTSTRGVVLDSEIESVCEHAHFLPCNRWEKTSYKDNLYTYNYSNGVVVRDLIHPVSQATNLWVKKLQDQENLTILETHPQEHLETIKQLKQIFPLEGEVKHVYHLIKKDGGFSRFENLNLDIPETSTVYLFNHSRVPSGYRYFNIAEDWTGSGKPWIQMYHFPPERVMRVSGKTLKNMSLTPLEEIFYRNEVNDAKNGEASTLLTKLVSELEIYVIH